MIESEHFKDIELACSCCGVNKVAQESLDRLERLRKDFGAPLKLSSAYRCPAHNAKISKTGETGPHTTGRAFDVVCSADAASRVLRIAIFHGFTGLGVSQKGDHASRFIHVDDILGSPIHARPRVWSY